MVWETRKVREENWVGTYVVYLCLHATQHDWLTPFGSQVMMMMRQDLIL